jgi:hypothetical protein
MAFDGRYRRRVREAGELFTIVISRARSGTCQVGDALLPDFVLRRRRDSATAVGAAALGRAVGIDLLAGAERLYASLPQRTVRSWRQRFEARSEELTSRFEALSATFGSSGPHAWGPLPATMTAHSATAIAAMWNAAARRRGRTAIPAPWLLANLVVGGQLLGTPRESAVADPRVSDSQRAAKPEPISAAEPLP